MADARLCAPDRSHVDVAAPAYYVLATGKPGMTRWLAQQVREAASLVYFQRKGIFKPPRDTAVALAARDRRVRSPSGGRLAAPR